MNIYEYRDYKLFLKDWLKDHPKAGRGQMKKMADHLRVSTTLLSQALQTDKHLSLETSAEICEYIGLGEKESEYFLLLVDYQRAGAFKLKKILERKLDKEQRIASQLQNRITKDRELTDVEKMQFYSSWAYSAIRIISALPNMNDIHSISDYLKIPVARVKEIVDFLIEKNLCQLQDGKLTYGVQQTYIGISSPFVVRHHTNWRLQGLQKMELRRDEDLFYTHTLALSNEAAEKIRLLLPRFIEEILAISRPSESETVRCISIDWFEF